jgi:hypothetical protein
MSGFSNDEEITTTKLELHKVVMEMLRFQDRVLMSEVARKVEWNQPGWALTMLVESAGTWTGDYVCAMQRVDGKETGDVIIHKDDGEEES